MWWWILLGVVVFLVILFARMFSCGKKEDELRDRLFAEYLKKNQNEIGVSCDLSNLDKMGLEQILNAYDEHGVNMLVNEE